jgi:uncharacterized membrane protein YjdF
VTPPGRAIADLATRQPGAFASVCACAGLLSVRAAVRGDGRFFGFLVIVVLGVAAVALADRGAHFSTGLLRALAVFACAHLVGGLLPSPSGAPTFYDTWIVDGLLRYDQAVHFAGSALATCVAWQVLGRHLDPVRTSAVVQAQLAAAIGLGKGALNEVVEFLAATSGQNVIIGDGTNTGWDLVFNLGGVVTAAVWLAGSGARRSTAEAERGVPALSR